MDPELSQIVLPQRKTLMGKSFRMGALYFNKALNVKLGNSRWKETSYL